MADMYRRVVKAIDVIDEMTLELEGILDEGTKPIVLRHMVDSSGCLREALRIMVKREELLGKRRKKKNVKVKRDSIVDFAIDNDSDESSFVV